MCRFLALEVERPQFYVLNTLLNAFISSSLCDPYLAKLKNINGSSHDDGWGFASIGSINETPVINHYKSMNPIYNDLSREIISRFINRFSRYEKLYLILHSRRTSKTEPWGQEYSHPYNYVLGKMVYWFAHNGSCKKKMIAEKLGVNPWIKTDSELLGQFIVLNTVNCMRDENGIDKCIVDVYNRSREFIEFNSALNTALLILLDSNPYLYVSHWVNTNNQIIENYYSIYSYISEELVLAGSISIKEYLPPPYQDKLNKLEYGVYRLKPGEIVKLSPL
ncbi:MAG: class II glutamine amidotransferase [Desulfurococcaceae archaeon]